MLKYALVGAVALAAAVTPLASTADATTFPFKAADSSRTLVPSDVSSAAPSLNSSYGSDQAVTALTAPSTAAAAGSMPGGAATLVVNPGAQTQTSLDTGPHLATGFTDGGLGINETVSLNVASAAPEAGAWALMLLGFVIVGGVMRTRVRGASVGA